MSVRFGLPTTRPTVFRGSRAGLVVGAYKFTHVVGDVMMVEGPDTPERAEALPHLAFNLPSGKGDLVVHAGPLELLRIQSGSMLMPWTLNDLFSGPQRDKYEVDVDDSCGLRDAMGVAYGRKVILCVRTNHTLAVTHKRC